MPPEGHSTALLQAPVAVPVPPQAAAAVAAVVPAPAAVPGGGPGRLRIALALLAVYVLWGSTYLAMRVAVSAFPVFLMAATRFLIAGTGLYAFLRLRGAAAPSLRQWSASAVVGGLLLFLGNGGVAFSLQWVSSSLAALAIAAVPLWAALFAGLFGRWPTPREWLGLLLGSLGVGLLNLEGNLRASPLGAAALMVASASWALGSVWSRRLPLPPGLMASAAQMITGGAMLLCLGLLRGERVPWPVSGAAVLGIAYLIVFGSLIGYSAYQYLLRHVRPALATSYAFVNPLVAVVLGMALAGERISAAGYLAMGVILSGVALVLWRR